MRKLEDSFMKELKDENGILHDLLEEVRSDKDLDLQIRENYINIYYKGNSLLKLTEKTQKKFEVSLDKKFKNGTQDLSDFLMDEQTTKKIIKQMPRIKRNIIEHGKHMLEAEFEQMLIRANNLEPKNNSEYFIIDRQYQREGKKDEGRFDITGIYWQRDGRRKGQTVPLCLMEIKYALNPDIRNINDQLKKYYDSLKNDIKSYAKETETILKQKADLGLIKYDPSDTLKSLKVSDSIDNAHFIIVLIDYNPNSKLFDIEKLKTLPFAEQISIFTTGFAMWKQYIDTIETFACRYKR